jgi:hypothetical protein
MVVTINMDEPVEVIVRVPIIRNGVSGAMALSANFRVDDPDLVRALEIIGISLDKVAQGVLRELGTKQ